jgi:small subunit ribosomal protein S16
MPVKIRLTRMGKKKQPTYRVVVVDSRKPRDGAHIEQIGRYDPRQEPSIIEIDLKWLQDGAQPTDRARKLLEISGAWARFRVARGEIHTIEEATPPPAPAAPAEEPVVEEAPAPEAAVEEAEAPAADESAEPDEAETVAESSEDDAATEGDAEEALAEEEQS